MSNSPSRGGGQGPSPKQSVLEIVRVVKGTEAYFRLLSPNYGGLLTHYRHKQSHYCPGPDCPRGEHKDPIWKGYCAAEQWLERTRVWMPCVFELTESCELDMRGRFRRGQIWRISRKVQKKNGSWPVSAALVEQLDEVDVPPMFEIRGTLCSLYHVEEIALDVSNPLPARVVVEPSSGAPPSCLRNDSERQKPSGDRLEGKLRDLVDKKFGQMPD